MTGKEARPSRPACEVVGHRGAAGLAPENTFEAFEKAVALGVDSVEFDVRRTSDGHAIVFHDATLERFLPALAPDRASPVSDHPLAVLRRVDVGSRFGGRPCRIPTLDEVFVRLRGRTRLNVECKGAGSDGLMVLALAIASLHAHGLEGEAILSSFEDEVLARAGREAPEIPRALIASGRRSGEDLPAVARDLGCRALHVDHRLASARLVDRCHVAGLAVRTWTVNEPARMRRLVSLGVDGIVTDFPDRLLRVLGRT